MLNIFKRRRRRSTIEVDNPLAIRNLLDHPALRAIVVEAAETPDVTPSSSWAGLAASGPIRFDLPTYPDIAA